jgi:hypothetical protein
VITLMPTMALAADYSEWTDASKLPTTGTYKLMTDVTLSGEVTIGS